LPLSPDTLSIYTVYADPVDFPGKFVWRRFTVCPRGLTRTDDVAVADTLEACRKTLPPGLHCLNRDPSDDPAIVESWV
jgi:hypothetical protein